MTFAERIAEAAQDPQIGAAMRRGMMELVEGKIDYPQYRAWILHLLEPVVLCPWCGDWEEVSEAEIRDERMWCCSMCAIIPERAGQ